MDNAPWHKKTLRLIDTEKQPEYADIAASVQFLRLPPYSPDLNPIEQVWRITRKENTHNTFFASINNLTETVDNAFEVWAVPNEQLKSDHEQNNSYYPELFMDTNARPCPVSGA